MLCDNAILIDFFWLIFDLFAAVDFLIILIIIIIIQGNCFGAQTNDA